VIIPSIWEAETFLKKLGTEKEEQMWTFPDRGNRNVCLIPEVTGVIQERWREEWSKTLPKPTRLFYVSRCYRYERPQAGRYREFTQFGVEILGGRRPEDTEEALSLLKGCMRAFGEDFVFVDAVKRGLSYYVEDGFEVEAPWLGAQKQVAGGGRYQEGIGWAIGVDRLTLALDRRT
jgi:histidyl-tRNA synthetase